MTETQIRLPKSAKFVTSIARSEDRNTSLYTNRNQTKYWQVDYDHSLPHGRRYRVDLITRSRALDLVDESETAEATAERRRQIRDRRAEKQDDPARRERLKILLAKRAVIVHDRRFQLKLF